MQLCYNGKVKCKTETSIDGTMKCLWISGQGMHRKGNIFRVVPSKAAIRKRLISGEICYLLFTHSLLTQCLKKSQPGTFLFFSDISRGKINDIRGCNISVGQVKPGSLAHRKEKKPSKKGLNSQSCSRSVSGIDEAHRQYLEITFFYLFSSSEPNHSTFLHPLCFRAN